MPRCSFPEMRTRKDCVRPRSCRPHIPYPGSPAISWRFGLDSWTVGPSDIESTWPILRDGQAGDRRPTGTIPIGLSGNGQRIGRCNVEVRHMDLLQSFSQNLELVSTHLAAHAKVYGVP